MKIYYYLGTFISNIEKNLSKVLKIFFKIVIDFYDTKFKTIHIVTNCIYKETGIFENFASHCGHVACFFMSGHSSSFFIAYRTSNQGGTSLTHTTLNHLFGALIQSTYIQPLKSKKSTFKKIF